MDDRPERRRVHNRIRGLEPAVLRELLADLWRRQGYLVTVVEEAVLATGENGETVEIHVIDPEDDFEGLLETTRAEEVVLVTTTADVKSIRPTRPSVRLVNGRELTDLLVDLSAEDLLEEDVGNPGSLDVDAVATFSLVALVTVGWFLSVLVLTVGPVLYPPASSTITVGGAVGTVTLWLSLPLVVFLDATRTRERGGDYRPPRVRWYSLSLLGGGFASSYYLWKRLVNG